MKNWVVHCISLGNFGISFDAVSIERITFFNVIDVVMAVIFPISGATFSVVQQKLGSGLDAALSFNLFSVPK